MMIETQRLKIIPLNSRMYDLWINDLKGLEKELKITYQAEPIENEFKEILKSQLQVMLEDEENYFWYTFWLIIRKIDAVCIGSIDFKCKPNSKREVEIGYGLGKEFEHNGFMTEATKAFCQWAFDSKCVSRIIVETEIENIKSQKVLLRCGFEKYSQKETNWYQLKK